MGFTFFSCLHTVFWSILITGCLHFFRIKRLLSESDEAHCLLIAYLLCIVRIIVPIDFHFSTGISFGGIYAVICDFMLQKRLYIFSYAISCWDAFLIAWAMGAIWMVCRFLMHYYCYMKALDRMEIYSEKQICKVLPRVFRHLGKAVSCTVYKIPGLHTPAAVGIIRKRVLLPDEVYSDEELFYILTHELGHFTKGDLLIKFAVQLCICAFWWNPVLWLIQKDLAQLLEIRCDAAVTRHLCAEDTLNYMETIINVLKSDSLSAPNMRTADQVSVCLSEHISERSELERFHVIKQDYAIRKRNPAALTACFIAAVLFLVSYMVLPIPSYEAPVSEIAQDGAVYIDPEKSWVTEEDDDCYLYANGEKPIPVGYFTFESLLNSGFSLGGETK